MGDASLLSRDGYFIAFEGFAETGLSGAALRIFLRGSENETDLLLNLPGTMDRWHIDFHSYAMYSVTCEDFTAPYAADTHTGHALRIYQQSDLLTYLTQRVNIKEQERQRTIHYKHYGFFCMEHQVDIVSSEEPIIALFSAC
ncbi:MAG: hypothetical protein L0G95_14185 [Planococcus sp. (in: firmicutes)]|nr:hypothetical protein [Planococcus sp. (in: firmicutes)]